MAPFSQKQDPDARRWHDVKNDLGAVLGFVEILFRSPNLLSEEKDLVSKAKTVLQRVLTHLEALRAPAFPSEESKPSLPETGDAPPKRDNPHLRGYETLLLVEDDEMYRLMLRMALESYGYTVLSAASGKEAIALFQEKKEEIDLVLIDFFLPGMSGLEVCQILRRSAPRCRMVFLSGAEIEEADERLLHVLQISAFLSKPIAIKDLVGRLRSILDSPRL